MSDKKAETFLSKILSSSVLETSAPPPPPPKQCWFFLFWRLCRLDDIEYGGGGGGMGGWDCGYRGIKELSLDAFEIECEVKYRSVDL